MLGEINRKIRGVTVGLDAPDELAEGVSVPAVIHGLANSENWSAAQRAALDQLSRRIDITGTLLSRYDVNWRKLDEHRLQEPWLGLAVLLLYKSFQLDFRDGGGSRAALKRMNVLLKALDLTSADYLARDSLLHQDILKDFSHLGEVAIIHTPRSVADSVPPGNTAGTPQQIPLTVLFWEGPIARAYLETLQSLGLAPQKIVNMVASVDVSEGKPVGRLLPGGLRKDYAAVVQRRKMHYWSRQIRKNHADLVSAMVNAVSQSFDFSEKSQKQAVGLRPLSDYGDNVVDRLVTGIRDPELQNYLDSEPASTILFTGGGIVPERLLTLPNKKFVHFHPGFLPDIRGADGLLWSTLLTGHPSATCFYMSPGIDTGDIVKPCWLPPIRFRVDNCGIDLKTLYRAIYFFIDPWVRSYVLRDVLRDYRKFDDMPSVAQRGDEGVTYHFMHEQVQALAVKKLIEQAPRRSTRGTA